ncbi:MAG: hypothetical protein JO149_00900, partial [Gammaproteobacteria bacterium]|nr:hypothetical protein [Gammaproteobacteria bacterium]
MFSKQDERKGLVKTTWKNISSRVSKIEPEFSRLVEELSPDETFPLYLAYYPYGSMDADTESTLFPGLEGEFFRLTDSNVSREILTDLGYSINNTPLSMVLEKQIESFVDLNNKVTIPSRIYIPGNFFPITKIVNPDRKRTYAPYKLLCSTAGARSAFMLPKIGCTMNHAMLKRDFKIKSPAPKALYYHWHIFKEIVNSSIINSDWRCCVIYFSEKWVEKIHRDNKWGSIKQYLQNKVWNQCEYNINRVHYDMIFSIIQKNRNLKPNPYLTDTAKHLFTIALGESPGYAPATNENALPATIIQKIFIETYNLKYTPTIFHPIHYHFEQDTYPVYYSLQNPSTLVFSPKSRELCTTLYEMRELEHIMKIFSSELIHDASMCSINSIMNKLAKQIKIDYFHNKIDSHQIIQHSSKLPLLDNRFHKQIDKNILSKSKFACDGPFLRGC